MASVREAEAHNLVDQRIRELVRRGYPALRAAAGEPSEVEQVQGSAGEYRRESSVRVQRRGGEEEVWLHVRVGGGAGGTRLAPLAEDRVVVSPDGSAVRDYTMAAESLDTRRYDFPPALVAFGVVLALALLLALILFS